MHNSEYKKSVRIAYLGGGYLSLAAKPMGDLAHDGTIPATINLHDANHAAAERNAIVGMRYSATFDGAKVEYHGGGAEKVRAADVRSDRLVAIGPDKATTMFRGMAAVMRPDLLEELSSGVAA